MLYIIYITLKQLLNNVGVRIALRIQRPPDSIKANQYEDLNLEDEDDCEQLGLTEDEGLDIYEEILDLVSEDYSIEGWDE